MSGGDSAVARAMYTLNWGRASAQPLSAHPTDARTEQRSRQTVRLLVPMTQVAPLSAMW
jgi:hypothetical protein